MAVDEAKCNDCVDCNEKINGIQFILETGQLAKAIEDVFPALGKGLNNILELVDIDLEARLLTTGVKVGLENTQECRKDKSLNHTFTLGFTRCD